MSWTRKVFSLTVIITGGPVLLLLLTTVILGTVSYRTQSRSAIDHVGVLAKVAAQPILNLMRASVGGGNYANVQDSEALSLYSANAKLRFFSVGGKTDQDGEPFGLLYHAGQSKVFRTVYPETYVPDLEKKIERATVKLAKLPANHRIRPKIEKIVAGMRAKVQQYQDSKTNEATILAEYPPPLKALNSGGYYLDTKAWLLHLVLPIGNAGGGVIRMVLDAEEVRERQTQVLWTVVPLALIVLLVSTVLSWLFSRTVTRPMNSMLVTIGAIDRDADLGRRLQIASKNEMGDIATALNSMLETFHSTMQEAATNADTLHASSGELFGVSDQVSDSASDMHAKSNTAAVAAEDLSTKMATAASTADLATNNVNMMAQATEEITLAINEIARNAEKARQVTSDAVASATQAVSRVDELDGATQEIGRITNVIADIAEQTKLLALTATIEAARAVEAGKGFTVVANEVKELAAQSNAATEDIRRRIDTMQRCATGAVGEIGSISQVVTDVNEFVVSISTAVEQLAGATRDMADNTKQVAAGIEEMTGTVTEAAGVSQMINSEVAMVSHTSSAVKAVSTQLNTHAARLSSMGQELKTLIHQFKLRDVDKAAELST